MFPVLPLCGMPPFILHISLAFNYLEQLKSCLKFNWNASQYMPVVTKITFNDII